MVIDIKGLSLYKKIGGFLGAKTYKIIDDFTLSIKDITSTTLYGDKYSGKYHIARMIIKLIKPSKGEVIYNGIDILKLPNKDLNKVRRKINLIFKDPIGMFNNRMNIFENIKWICEMVGVRDFKWIFTDLLSKFNIGLDKLDLYPMQVTIFERLLISIARSMALEPELLILENPTLLIEWNKRQDLVKFIEYIKREYNISLLIFTSDLGLLKSYGDMIGILHMGRLIEYGVREEVIKEPLHPYVKWLLSVDQRIMDIEDIVEYSDGIAVKYIDGCRYKNCIFRDKICENAIDTIYRDNRSVKCVLYK